MIQQAKNNFRNIVWCTIVHPMSALAVFGVSCARSRVRHVFDHVALTVLWVNDAGDCFAFLGMHSGRSSSCGGQRPVTNSLVMRSSLSIYSLVHRRRCSQLSESSVAT